MKKINLILLFLLLFVAISFVFYLKNPSSFFVKIYKWNQSYTHYSDDNVDIFYHREQKIDFKKVATLIDTSKSHAEQLFGNSFDSVSTIPIFITMPGDRAFDKALSLQLTGGYLNDEEIILINGIYYDNIESAIVHEYSHYLLDQLLKKHKLKIDVLPAWFWEGVAYHFEHEITNLIPFRYSPSYTHLPFKSLVEVSASNTNAVYNQGFYAIERLLYLFDETILKDILHKVFQGLEFVDAFEQETKIKLSEYHKEFEINKNRIYSLEEKAKKQPSLFYEEVTMMLDSYGEINQYSPFLLGLLVDYCISVDEIYHAKRYFEVYESYISNPAEFIQFASLFVVKDEEYANYLIKTGEEFSRKYHFDLNFYHKEVESTGFFK